MDILIHGQRILDFPEEHIEHVVVTDGYQYRSGIFYIHEGRSVFIADDGNFEYLFYFPTE